MGAEQFTQAGKGATAKEAFHNARQVALYEYGHQGYTGSMAEKDSFVEIPLPEGKNPMNYAYDLMDNDDERIDDKWGRRVA